nr:MAG TPA: hypothetical protein [Caudoviricetes sp.]
MLFQVHYHLFYHQKRNDANMFLSPVSFQLARNIDL